MARRYLRQNAALDDLVGNLASGPLADRALGLARLFASQAHDLAHLLSTNLSRSPWARRVRQPLGYTQIVQGHGLQAQPTLAPVSHRISLQTELARNMAVVGSAGRRQDEASAQPNLLRRGVATHQRLQPVPFRFTQFNVSWLGTAH